MYPNILDGCCGCPPFYYRDIEIAGMEWYVEEEQVLGNKNTSLNIDILSKKVKECCEYLLSNMKWFWTDKQLNELNMDYDDFCKNK